MRQGKLRGDVTLYPAEGGGVHVFEFSEGDGGGSEGAAFPAGQEREALRFANTWAAQIGRRFDHRYEAAKLRRAAFVSVEGGAA